MTVTVSGYNKPRRYAMKPIGTAVFVHGLITSQTMELIKEHRQPPACLVTKSFTPLTGPGDRHAL